jgi:outer membrane protein assembly factor BamB
MNSQHTGTDVSETTLKPPLTLQWLLPQASNAAVIEYGGVIYAKNSSGILYSIDANTGAINWQVQTSGSGEIAFYHIFFRR